MITHIFIIPGNPGVIEYYYDFAKNLKINNLKVDILEYKNFSETNSEKFLSIEEEIIDKRDQILKIIDYNNKNILVGHSIGGWISLKLMKEINFQSCILIFPFLKKDFFYKQLAINFLLNYKNYFIITYDKIRKNLFGNMFLTYLINSFSMSDDANKITKKWFLNKDIVNKCLNLAKSEFDTLNYQFDFELIESIKHKLVFYYCNNDIWAPINDYNIISNLGCKTKLINCSHDFCVKKDEVKIITTEILKDINE